MRGWEAKAPRPFVVDETRQGGEVLLLSESSVWERMAARMMGKRVRSMCGRELEASSSGPAAEEDEDQKVRRGGVGVER